jgi:hypothetical protein
MSEFDDPLNWLLAADPTGCALCAIFFEAPLATFAKDAGLLSSPPPGII